MNPTTPPLLGSRRSRRALLAVAIAALAAATGGLAVEAGVVASAARQKAASAATTAGAPAWRLERTFGAGGPVALTVRLDRTDLTLDQNILLEEELRVAPGFTAEIPELLPSDLDGLSPVQSSAPAAPPSASRGEAGPPGLSDGREDPEDREATDSRRRLHLEPRRTGTVALRERFVFYRPAGATATAEQALPVGRIELRVSAAAAGTARAVPEGATVVGLPRGSLLAWLGGAALALTALAAAAFVLGRRAVRAAEAALPPHEAALLALERLDADHLLERGDFDGFFVRLSGILREYVERRFGLRAPELTSEEFLRAAELEPALATRRALLRAFLRLADAVKFACERPPSEEAHVARWSVGEIVETTRPVEPAASSDVTATPSIGGQS